jgi:hypothetical protein
MIAIVRAGFIAALIARYEAELGQKVSFAFHRPGDPSTGSGQAGKNLVTIRKPSDSSES